MPYLGNQHIVGDSVHNFKVLDDISSYTETFDGSASSVVSTADETIKVINHRFVQGQRVTYNNGGGGNIGGISSGTAYYVTYDSANTIKLATTLVNANNNTNINLTSVGSGTAHTLTAAFDGVNKKFRITHGGGTRARFSQASQLRIAINNVVQKANNDHLNFSEGYAIAVRSIIVFQTAPTVNDVFFGSLLGETLGTFDISDHKIDNHTGDGSTVNFSLSRNVPNVQSLLVTLDGVLQHASDATTSRAYSLIADNIIRFTAAPASGVQIQIRHLGFAGAATGEVSGFYGRTGNVTLGVTDNISIGDISTSKNINATGIVTASSFVGDGSGLIGVASTDNIVTGTAATFNTYPVDINAGMTVAGVSTFGAITATSFGSINATTGTFSGNVTIGGTLTYEDVTNIDSVGVITAKGADINGDLDVDGHTNLDNVSVAGVTTFSDDVYFDGATAGRDIIFDRSANTLHVKNNAILKIGESTGTTFSNNGTNTQITHSPISSFYVAANTFQVFGSGTRSGNTYDNTLLRLNNGVAELGHEIPNGGAAGFKLATSAKGITVGTGVTVETNGQATFVGVVTFGSGSTTIDNNVVNVGTALTLGHTQGLQFHTQNLHSAGFEVNQINASGIVTASSFSGSVAASNLTGTIPTARLGSGTANSSTFLRGDSTFAVVDTALVADTSPQLGGNLDVNTKNIVFGDSGGATDDRLTFGAGTDFSIYHNGSHTYLENDTGNLVIDNSNGVDMYINSGNDIYIRPQGTENGIKVFGDGEVQLYCDNTRRLRTTTGGITISGTDAGGSEHFGRFYFKQESGTVRGFFDPAAQKFAVYDNSQFTVGNANDGAWFHDGSNTFFTNTTGNIYIQNDGSSTSEEILIRPKGGENSIRAIANGSVELYHDNFKCFNTNGNGITLTAPEGGDCVIDMNADEGDDNPDKWRINISQGGSFQLKNYADGSWENHIQTTVNSAVELYHNGSKKLETTSAGVQVTGALTTNNGGGNAVLGSHLDLGDNQKVRCGAGDDLQFHHDSSDSYISSGTGNFVVQHTNNSGDFIMKANDFYLRSNTNENYFRGQVDGAVQLFHDNSSRLTTTSTGVTLDGTGALKFPVGTTAQRPSASQGMVRYNSTTSQLEIYNGSAWNNVNSQPFEASGGSESTSSRSGYKVHTFTSPGTFAVSGDVDNKTVEVLAIGGGGAGGEGGGGAGALRFSNSYPISPGNYSVSIGGGGSGSQSQGNNGSSTSFGSFTAPGGGGGGGNARISGNPGGSGGGTRRDNGGSPGSASGSGGGSNNSNSPSSGWGNNGGNGAIGNWCGGGGGGGAGGAGGQGQGGGANSERGGPGGSGLSYSINGSSVGRAGGGGGGCEGSGNPSGPGRGGNTSSGGGRGGVSNRVPGAYGASAGSSNTGGGGGGNASTGYSGGNHSGGSGIVIVAYTV